jgi:hypothetical protein
MQVFGIVFFDLYFLWGGCLPMKMHIPKENIPNIGKSRGCFPLATLPKSKYILFNFNLKILPL